MFKKELREIYIRKRQAISETDAALLSIEIASRFFSFFDFSLIQSVHVFLPIRHKAEIDTWLIIERLRSDFPNVKIIVPKIDAPKENLDSFLLQTHTNITVNSWGISEPSNESQAFNDLAIDMVLLPLLAFDGRGNRVGYGKGFYDKFLENCRPDVIKTGLTFFEAESLIEDIASHDVPLDFCVTPAKVYDFKK